MSDEVTILSMHQMQKLVDDIESAQDEMDKAIIKWQIAKSSAEKKGLDLRTGDELLKRTWVFPIVSVSYEPAIEFKLNN